MKPIIFIGAERVGKDVLKSFLDAKKNIVAVFTAHPALKDKIADYVDFSDIENSYPEIDFNYILSSKDLLVIEKIKSYQPEVIFVISWSQIIPKEILKIPPKGVIGLHYSLLPERRGSAPLNWAIIDDLKESGMTLFYMNEGIDSGDIIDQRKMFIDQEDTVNDLLEKIRKIAPSLVMKNFDVIIEGKISKKEQNENRATYTSRRKPEDSEIDWSWNLRKVYNFIRALAPPYPSAFFKLNNKKIVLTSAKIMKDKKIKIEGYIENDDQS